MGEMADEVAAFCNELVDSQHRGWYFVRPVLKACPKLAELLVADGLCVDAIMRRRGNFTEDEDRTLSRMFWDGATDYQIGVALNRPVSSVAGRRSKLGLVGIPRSQRGDMRWN